MGFALALLKAAAATPEKAKAAPAQTAVTTYTAPAEKGRALSLMSTALASAPPRPPIETLDVPVYCAKSGSLFVRRVEKFKGSYGYRGQTVPKPGQGDAANIPPVTISIRHIQFPLLALCPHCWATVSPVHCNKCGQLTCDGGIEKVGERTFARCTPACNSYGELVCREYSVSANRDTSPAKNTARPANPATTAPDRLRLSSSTSKKGSARTAW